MTDRISFIEAQRFAIRVCFDDGSSLILRKKDVEKLKLSAGQEWDREVLVQKLSALQFTDAYEAALDILDRSARSREEIRKKLLFKGYMPQVADAVCERLTEARLLDDSYIARRVTAAMSASGKGKYAVLQKLKARGIAKEDSLEALGAITDEDQQASALQQAEKLLKKYAALPERERKSKMSQALARRGFSWDSIEYALERLTQED